MNATPCLSRSCLQLTSVAQRRIVTVPRPVHCRPRRNLTTWTWTASTRPPVLDFLLPPPRPMPTKPAARSPRPPPAKCRCQFASSAAVSPTPPLQQNATTIANPRHDEHGNELTIEITPRASNRLKEIMQADSNPALLLRITVESGGCHGFQYLMSLTDASSALLTDDTIFEAPDDTGARVVMDEPSLELLRGSKVDYTMELIGSQFRIADNPKATSSCGCGTSFDVKF